MIATKFRRCSSTINPLSFLLLVLPLCCNYSLAIIVLLNLSSSVLTSPQTIRTTNSNDQYPVTTITASNFDLPVTTNQSTTSTSTTTATPTTSTISSGKGNTSSYPYQPKSLKFTLISGKHWRFNIKANSFNSIHNEGELRLHKNVSINNYIIDDDGWFQYNPQQQQLFAWPNLFVQPGTYYFVLLPSGTDFEADSENAVKSLDVVANIIVELIRPLRTISIEHIDRNIDHKFSLDFLHRHQTYPLLLQQIVSVFDTITRPNQFQLALSTSSPTTTTASTTTTITSINNTNTSNTAAVLAQQRNLKLANKLNEYLLISSTYSSDGEFFSLTWSVHPSLVNNTITTINECRIATINETVSKLSNLTSGYYKEKYVIYYPIVAPFVNSNAIVPTERGNNSLKLYLNGPCQREKIIQELISSPRSASSMSSSPLSTNIDDKDNNISDSMETTTPKTLDTTTISSGLSALEAIDSSTASYTTAPTTTAISLETSLPQFPSPESSSQPPPQTTTSSTPVTFLLSQPTPSTTSLSEASQPLTQSENIETSSSSREILSSQEETNMNITRMEAQIIRSELPPTSTPPPPPPQQQQVQQTKMQPQAKSFANYLESNDVQTQPNITMTSMIDTTENSNNASSNLIIIPSNATLTNNSIENVTPTNSSIIETSINEDLIGILDDVMNYLVSVAVPASVIIGVILLLSILIALFSLCLKRRKSKQFQVRNRFDFKYSSERRGFLKSSSKPVILEADQKSLSLSGTPQHRPAKNNSKNNSQSSQSQKSPADYLPMHAFSSTGYSGGVGKVNGDIEENHS